jgi:hypothetical protein
MARRYSVQKALVALYSLPYFLACLDPALLFWGDVEVSTGSLFVQDPAIGVYSGHIECIELPGADA